MVRVCMVVWYLVVLYCCTIAFLYCFSIREHIPGVYPAQHNLALQKSRGGVCKAYKAHRGYTRLDTYGGVEHVMPVSAPG